MSNDAVPRAARRWSFFQRCLLLQASLCAALLLALVAAELVLRRGEGREVLAAAERPRPGAEADRPQSDQATLHENGLYVQHPYLAYVQRPGAERVSKSYSWHINTLGFRGAEIEAAKPAGTTRILCLGGSTTFGTGVRLDRNTYPASTERELEALAPGRRFEVVNCGVSGYTSVECLIDLELRLIEFQPDAVLLYHGANDALVIQERDFQPDYTHMRTAWVEHELRGPALWLSDNSALWRWLAARGGADESLLDSHIYVEDWKRKLVPSTRWINPEGLRVFRRNLEHTVLVARASGILPILSTFATCRARPPHPSSDFFDVVDAMNRLQLELAAELDVPILRIAELMPGDARHFDDWMHTNDEGAQIHGRLAAAELARLGLFGLESAPDAPAASAVKDG